MPVGIKISLNEGLYLRDPQDSNLGRNIIKYSILLIDQLGFESFTFRKLAAEMGSTEASIYRYFENKHVLLIYLVSWYWEWVGYLIRIGTMNIEDPQKKLNIIIKTFVSASIENPAIEYVNESVLHNVVIAEGSKTYHTKEVDTENSKGFFLNYKRMIAMVAEVVLEINPKHPYPIAFAINLFEMANNHIYFAEHLPRLTDIKASKDKYKKVEEMLQFFAGKFVDA